MNERSSAMTVIEVAVFAMVLTGGKTPFFCESKGPAEESVVTCTNGLTTDDWKGPAIHYSNGVVVSRQQDASLSFSNGLTAHWGAASWVQFSNGVGVRRIGPGTFKSSTGLTCQAGGDTKASCAKDD